MLSFGNYGEVLWVRKKDYFGYAASEFCGHKIHHDNRRLITIFENMGK